MGLLGNSNGNVVPLCALPVTAATASLLSPYHSLAFLLQVNQILQGYAAGWDMGYRLRKSHVIGALICKDFSA